MAYPDDSRILLKVAHMYYDECSTQAEIAETLGVSRPMISKYLAKSRELGLVEIIVHDRYSQSFTALEGDLERKYKSREVIIVPETVEKSIKRSLGIATGAYLHRVAKKNQVIGVSGGTTLFEVSQALPKANIPLTIVPLVGGNGVDRLNIHSNMIATQIAGRFGAEYRLLNAPLVMDSPEAKQVMLNQSSIADVLNLAGRCDIALIGIGGTPEYSTMVKNYVGEEYQEELFHRGVIGDVCYNFIDANGEPSPIAWNDQVLALPLNTLRKIPTTVGIAHGEEKLVAIHTALSSGLINVLVTDQPTGERLLTLQ